MQTIMLDEVRKWLDSKPTDEQVPGGPGEITDNCVVASYVDENINDDPNIATNDHCVHYWYGDTIAVLEPLLGKAVRKFDTYSTLTAGDALGIVLELQGLYERM